MCGYTRRACVQAAEEVEAMSDAEVLSDVQSSLQALFPGTWREPLAHAVTRWGQVGWVGWVCAVV